MNTEFLYTLAKIPETNLFLSKGYGLELLFYLERMGRANADNGIGDTFDALILHKPRRAAFSQFCQLLRDAGAIVYVPSQTKRSKSVLRLSDKAQQQLDLARETCWQSAPLRMSGP